jgi:hypothetical protein
MHSCPGAGATQARVEHTRPRGGTDSCRTDFPMSMTQCTALSAVEQTRPGAAQAAMDRHFHGGS